ncbi:MAG: polysaccharide biosynthesis protein [Defluviitaleaceae bacterium]|nr:polysaccharide biosynthesis protein [Defluviitaleaceae bacterium]
MTEDARNTHSFVRQAAILAAAGIFVRLLGFLYKLPLTDLIGDEGNAIYGVAFNIYNFFLLMSGAGLPAAISRLVAERRAIGRPDLAHRVFRVAFFLAAGIGAICTLIILFFGGSIAAALNSPRAYLGMLTLAPTVFIVSMMAVVRGYFQGMQTAVPTAISQIVEQALNAVFSVVMAHVMWNFAMNNAMDFVAYGAAGGTSGTGIGAMAGFVFIMGMYFLRRPGFLGEIRRAARKNRDFDDPEKSTGFVIRQILGTAFPIIAGTAVFSIVALIDTWMVIDGLLAAGFDRARADALFGQIMGKFNPITNIPAAVSAAIAIAVIPAIAASHKLRQRRIVRAKIITAFRAGAIITAPMAFGLGILGPQIVAMLFPRHPDGGTLFLVGFASIILLAISQIATGALQAIGKIYIPVFAAICGGIVKILCNRFLIPIESVNIYGAIIGTTACFAVAAAINCRALARHLRTKFRFFDILAKPLVASVVMALACYAFYHIAYQIYSHNTFATLIAIMVGAVTYGIVLLLLNGLSKEDLQMLPKGGKIYGVLVSYGIVKPLINTDKHG